MMGWIKNLISFSDSQAVGNCPSCGSKDISVNEHINGNRRSLTFICNNCNSSDHFDGMAKVDFDTSDHGLPKAHPNGAHKHTFDFTKKRPRGNPLPLTEEELVENEDIIQKGANYHDQG